MHFDSGLESDQVSDGLSAEGRQWVSLRKASSRIRSAQLSPSRLPSPTPLFNSVGYLVRKKQATEPTQEHTKRHADLLGVVSDIIGGRSDVTQPGLSSESEYCGEDGLAISDSKPFWAFHAARVESSTKQEVRHGEETQEDNQHRKCSQMLHVIDNHSSRKTSIPQPLPTGPLGAWDGQRIRDKSPSRSPIIRQSTALTIPSVLKRHSVYHSSPPDAHDSFLTPGSDFPSRHDGLEVNLTQMSDAVTIASIASAVAAKERAVLGIPPSGSESEHRESQPISYTDSHLSALEDASWQVGMQQLSAGAESMLGILNNDVSTRAVFKVFFRNFA